MKPIAGKNTVIGRRRAKNKAAQTKKETDIDLPFSSFARSLQRRKQTKQEQKTTRNNRIEKTEKERKLTKRQQQN